MKELSDLVQAWQSMPAGANAVLVTVVNTSGSTYRKIGARMLIADGQWVAGSISGGCLESDIVTNAWDATANGPTLATYDSTSEADAIWGFGMGCSGIVTVLIERLPADGGVLLGLAEVISTREPMILITDVTDGETLGKRWVSPSDEEEIGFDPALELGLLSAKRLERGAEAFLIERVQPPRRLYIFGAGHDAMPLAAMAKQLGYYVSVLDHRPEYCTADRFPTADETLLSISSESGQLAIEKGAAAVIMTHNYLNDLEVLKSLLGSPVSYIGVLGPRKRTAKILHEIGAEFSPRIHSPVGLDIGAEGPEEIALAVLAEIQSSAAERSRT